ncbi:asparagine synthase (glutamine-hydrolyzing) [Bacillus sp. DTU_2020_1000418_1_SI_GHA_SEK_038]|uniref:asparagine synthase (glutamine-hydrolyzing) n=1 Tax=Bacillus sp. DTU_2020_1000418_1_SI_GHA_SEK_038 TaxID=3077585 RepID=UPI0028EEC9F5|nr:asparagine synthase (glutamine-hydrolyzing) [Bacillus sp. DTU_2020_1000418_1_SI_GHA_SEK_038]WNS74671.1 asparagine synthase (glutamine-hydrolyzing) [Bacillus sp. DTU_2020_1000418_1_SI_GHA_SEK_038]
MSGFSGFVKRKNDNVDTLKSESSFYDGEHVIFHYLRCDEKPCPYQHDRYWIVFTGEITNINELKGELSECANSVQEILLILYRQLKAKIVEKLRGLYALVIWDDQDKVLFGARDPFGIKPFYYYEGVEGIYFSTEKKSILEIIQIEVLNKDALQQYLTYQFVPEPDTMTDEIRKLEPGHYFIKKIDTPMEIICYWKASFHPVLKQEAEFIREIKGALYQSIQSHTQSDAPIGSFLSGGIDSSIIAAIAKEYHPDLKTFSVGFEQAGFSEIDIAEKTAERLGIENISRIINPEEFIRELPNIVYSLEDPLADPACIPLYFASKEASKHVKIVLSGEGADELFGGYNIYREPHSLRLFQYIPNFIKRVLRTLAFFLPEGIRGKSFIERGVTPLEERYIGNAKIFSEAEKRMFFREYRDVLSYTNITAPLYKESALYDAINKMQYIDIHTWLRGDILLKAHKMTEAHLLDLRAPFLDKEVFEIASQIPSSLNIANGTTKYILRKAVEGIVPAHVLDRKKLGFPVPIRFWLKSEMYDWTRTIIRESDTDHLFHKDYFYRLLDGHYKDQYDNSRKLWTVLMFMLWYAVFIEKKYENELSSMNTLLPMGI